MWVVQRFAAVFMVCALATAAQADHTQHGRRVVVDDATVEILDSIRFVGTTAEITPASTKMIDAVAQTLDGNPSITRLEVVGYGIDKHANVVSQLALGEQRARAVARELVVRGIDPARLQISSSLHPDRANDPAPQFLIVKRG